MSGDTAKTSNNIARASLNESKRQYNEQKAKEKAKKETAMANASGTRRSGNMAYSNNFSVATDYTTGGNGSFSLLTPGNTNNLIGSLLGTDPTKNSTLGGK